MKLLLILLFPLSVFAGKTYNLEVKVLSKLMEKPLEGVRVNVYFEGQEIGKDQTNSEGIVKFTGLKEKQYDLIVYGELIAYQRHNGFVFNKKRKDCTRSINLVPEMETSIEYFEKIVDEFMVKTGSAYPVDTSEKCLEPSETIEAQFPGGQEKMFFFIMNYLEFPKESIELGEQGKVYLSFYVEPDGTLKEITILRGVSKSIDQEAKRIIKAMPRWIPGICNGKRIRTKMILPLNFALT